MEWTTEADFELRRLFEKRLSIAFIATWMRRDAGNVRLRLQSLGLAKARVAPLRQSGMEEDVLVADDDDEEDDMPVRRGRHRGHLMTDEQIRALYRKAGRNYAGPLD